MLDQMETSRVYPMLGEMKTWIADPTMKGRRLRAVTTTYPGGADQLWLERWRPEDDDGWELVERVEVKPVWINSVEILRWDGSHLYLRDMPYEPGWSEADQRKHSDHFKVPMSFDALGKKATKIRGLYFDRGGESAEELPAG